MYGLAKETLVAAGKHYYLAQIQFLMRLNKWFGWCLDGLSYGWFVYSRGRLVREGGQRAEGEGGGKQLLSETAAFPSPKTDIPVSRKQQLPPSYGSEGLTSTLGVVNAVSWWLLFNVASSRTRKRNRVEIGSHGFAAVAAQTA